MTTEIAKKPRDAFEAFAHAMQHRMAEVLPRTASVTAERMVRVILAERTRTPKLAQCSTDSLALCVLLSAQLGLEPSSPLGHFYLIPRGRECTALIGYKGLLELARRSGEISRINAGVFYRDEIENGTFSATVEPPTLDHRFSLDEVDRSDEQLAGAYCVVETKDGGRYQIILTRADIEKRRSRSASAKSSYSPWSSDYAAMARKSAIRALMNGGTVPISAEMRTYLEHESAPVVLDATVYETPSEPEEATTSGNGRAAAAIGMDTEDVIALEEGE